MDDTFIQAWKEVYDGNVPQQHLRSHIAQFILKYLPYCFIRRAADLIPVTADDLAATIHHISPSASGYDNVAPIDLQLLSHLCLICLAELLNVLVSGPLWPSQLLHAKGALLPKDPDRPFEPLAYRVLMVISSTHRSWAASRHRQLEPWISRWRLSTMFSGIPGVGAQDAWYDVALQIEHAHAQGQTVVGGAVDIHKCLDQLVRPLLYWLQLLGGFPSKLLIAYANRIEAMQIHFSFAKHIGRGHTRPSGIP